MKPEELLERPQPPTLEFDDYRLLATIEIKTPTGNVYCISWTYNGKTPIHQKEGYDLAEVCMEVNSGKGLKEIPFSKLEDDLRRCGFGMDVLDVLLTRQLSEYDTTKTRRRI